MNEKESLLLAKLFITQACSFKKQMENLEIESIRIDLQFIRSIRAFPIINLSAYLPKHMRAEIGQKLGEDIIKMYEPYENKTTVWKKTRLNNQTF